MPVTLDSIPESVQVHAMRLGSALAILLVGWLIALIVSSLVKNAIGKTKLGNTLGKLLFGEEKSKTIALDKWISKSLFYAIMFFVLLGFFEALELKVVTEPLQAFLNTIFEKVPTLIGPAILIFVAWIVANVLKFVVEKLVGNEKLSSQLNRWVGVDESVRHSAAVTLGSIVYWAVLLIFSMAILDALNLQGLLDPLKEMFEQILSFLPNVLAAALIFCIGWFLARIVHKVVTGLLESVGTDKIGERLGLNTSVGHKGLSGALGTVAYVLVLIPVIIASLNALNLQSITHPISEMLTKMLTVLPDLFAAILVITITYFVGRLLRDLITAALTSAGFNTMVIKIGFGSDPHDYQAMLGKMGIGEAPSDHSRTPAQVVGEILFVILLLFAGIEALQLMGFESLGALLTRFVLFLSQVLLGLVILGVALWVANLVAKTILASQSPQAPLLAAIARVSILVLAGAMALQQMGLAERIINLAFGIILGAFALAAAIAFGVGGQEVARNLLKDAVANFKKKK